MRQQHGAKLFRRAAVSDRQLGRLDVAVRRTPRDRDDPALPEDGQPLPGLGDGDKVDRDAGGAPSLDLTRELLGVALRARDLERAALAREAGGAGGGLGGEGGALEQRYAEAAAGQVVRRARAEGAGADDDDVSGNDHLGCLQTCSILTSGIRCVLRDADYVSSGRFRV